MLSNGENKNVNEDNIIDVNLDDAKRQKFRINGDPNAIIELNLSDLGIMDRLKTGMEKLTEEMARISELNNDDENLSEVMKQADIKMREYVDYIFDSPVSDACCKYGTMYDPKNGKFRYESIIEGLLKHYTKNINDEYEKITKRLAKHTEKYVNNKRRKN